MDEIAVRPLLPADAHQPAPPEARAHGIGHVLVDAIIAQGRERGWAQLRAPEKPASARRLAEQTADKGSWESYVIRLERKVDG
jgi:GNAT superfamily N-acetyltransferase